MGSIKRGLRMAFTLAMVATLIVMTAGVASAAGPKAKATYNSVPTDLPGNVSSQAFQAQQTSEFGDSIRLASGPRKADSVDVVMSSWGCETGTWTGGDCATSAGATFNHPITLNLYAVDPTTGQPAALVLSKTQTFAIPFRPSADPVNCIGSDAGKWFSAADATCYNGSATKISFELDGTLLPRDLIWTVAFNTSSYGAAPMGYSRPCSNTVAGCGYDSLNVGAKSFAGQPSVGTDVDTAGAVLDSDTAGAYCDNGIGGGGTLRLDTGCWTGFTPLATIRTR